MTALVITLSLLGAARAEEKTCLVKGMECQNCVEMVTKDVCTDAYATCQVTLKDKLAHVGQIHIVTKDPANKVDMKRVDDAVGKMNYSVASCVDGAPKAEAKKPTVKR